MHAPKLVSQFPYSAFHQLLSSRVGTYVAQFSFFERKIVSQQNRIRFSSCMCPAYGKAYSFPLSCSFLSCHFLSAKIFSSFNFTWVKLKCYAKIKFYFHPPLIGMSAIKEIFFLSIILIVLGLCYTLILHCDDKA